MARLAGVVVPGLTHHVTQRGNRREAVFFGDDDYRTYLDLISGAARRSGKEIWAYCLMPNHVHFIMTPSAPDGLRATFAEAHRRYAARIHARLKVTGHLWQGRFSSTAMDERHLMAAARYVPVNPVKARMAAARRTGHGRVRRRTWRGEVMGSSRSDRCWIASKTFQRSWKRLKMMKR